MSRSYRKPYATVTGCRSAADDKRVARRRVRRAQDEAIRKFKGEDWDEFLLPARYECSFNDVWSWGRDGKPWLHFAPTFEEQNHYYTCGLFTDEDAMALALEDFEQAKAYFEKLKRK